MAEVSGVGNTPQNPQDPAVTEKKEVPKKPIVSILSADGDKFAMPVADLPKGSIFTAHTKNGDRKICVGTGEENTFSCEPGLQTNAELAANGAQLSKINLASRLKSGADVNDVSMALMKDETLVSPFPETKPGKAGSTMKYYEGGKLSEDGNSVIGGKLVATVIEEDGNITSITDGKGHKFKVGKDGKFL